jgi:hypothetical protein
MFTPQKITHPAGRLAPMLLLLLTAALAFAGDPQPPVKTPADAPPSAFDQLWGLATLYKNDHNPILQELKLRGRYQGQYHWLDSDQGDTDDWENRRSRFGFDAKLFSKKIEIRLDAESNETFDPFYEGLVDAYLKWKPSGAFGLTVGRQKPQIGGYDWLASSNNTPTFERSQIFNQLRVNRATGAVLEGLLGQFTWQAGVYTNAVDSEFGQLDGGLSYGAGVGYHLNEAWGLKQADLRADWLHSDHEAGDTVLNRYDDLLSATLQLQDGRWGLVTEAYYGTGENAADVVGFFIQPTWDLLPEKLQLVGRYSFATGNGPDSVIAQSRYEREAPQLTGGGRGDRYQAAYLGLQYFIHGDRLKLMAGAEYARLDGGGNGGDFAGLTLLTGIRLSF